MSGLVSAEELRGELGDPRLRVLDATVLLDFPPDGGPPTITSGRAGYDAGHVPGAAFADLITDLSEPGSGLPFTVPSEERFAAAIAALGVGDDSRVVVYDQGATAWATRLWWLLRYFGFEDVRVLDGGQPAWEAAGGELSTEPASHAPAASFTARARPELLASTDDVLAATAGRRHVRRQRARRGHTSAPGASRAPRTWPPAACSTPTRAASGPLEELRSTIAAVVPADGPPPIAYCGGGIAATVDVFALALAGRDDAKLYDDSMTGWTADPARPVETG